MTIGTTRRVRLAMALVGVMTGAGGCAVPPWSMGAPLSGKPSIPATTEAPSTRSLRALAAAERMAGHTALELHALAGIGRADRLGQEERQRLATLLEQRAREFLAMGRSVPACADLRDLDDLAPARARELAWLHAAAERDAGDVWLGVGDARRAREAYEIAGALGAAGIDFRLVAASEPPLAPVDGRTAERAVLELPLRAVLPFATMYLDSGGATGPAPAVVGGIGEATDGVNALNRAALVRALAAARQEKQLALAARLETLLGAGKAVAPAVPYAPPASAGAPLPGHGPSHSADDRAAAESLAESLLDTPAAPTPSQGPPNLERLDEWVVGAASVSSRLLPLLEDAFHHLPPGGAVPAPGVAALLAPGPRARRWADLLLDEDPTSPDVLEVTAVIDALAGRVGGAERKLTDLVYFSPDRYQGLVRAAAIWERVGQVRLGCVAWLRAARWRDEIDDPAWGRAVDCMRRDPGAGDWRAVMGYILDQTPPARRAAAAAALDPTAAPLGALAAPPVSD